MAKMEEIRQLPTEEVKIRLRDSLDELANLKFQLALHQLDNPIKIRMLKRDVARFKTVLHEVELGIRKETKPQK
jgi:large subunit ribosomal protein L29